MTLPDPTPDPARQPPAGRLRRFAARLARPRGETVALVLVVALAAALLAVVHGLLPRRIQHLPVAYAYSGFIECLSDEGVLRAPVCPSLGIPLGFVPLTDGPYLVAAAAVRSVTGLEPLAAKEVTDVGFLLLSFLSLMALQRRLGIDRLIAALIATCYLVLPPLLGHAGIYAFYIGILLLPAYLLVELVTFSTLAGDCGRSSLLRIGLVGAGYTAVRTLALFQDPYTAVMMVAVSAVILIGAAGACLVRRRFAAAAVMATVWLVSVWVAVALYKSWVPGGADYDVMPIDFFRAQGADLISLFVPSGRLWWARVTDVGVYRWSAWAYYGDGTNVSYNYLGYTLLVPLLAWGAWRLARGRRTAAQPTGRPAAGARWPALAVAAGLCLVAALGPSIKLNDAREATAKERFDYTDYFMPPEAATLTLPTEELFVTLPAIRNMRVPYRFIVIPKLVLLLGFAAVASRIYARRRALGLALVGLALAEHCPDLPDLDRAAEERYVAYQHFNREVVDEMARFLVPGERVFFVSPANDYLVNYLAPRLDLESYNVGGDKNFILSEASWPASLVELRRGLEYFPSLAPPIARAFAAGDVDAVVIPYFDLRWHAYAWPPSERERRERRRPVRIDLDPPPPPLRIAQSWWFAVVSLDGARPRVGGGPTLTAEPNPIVICDGAKKGSTLLTWRVNTPGEVEVRVGAPDGQLLARDDAVGSAATGPWVYDGMEFFLQDPAGERPDLAPGDTLARVTVRIRRDCGP